MYSSSNPFIAFATVDSESLKVQTRRPVLVNDSTLPLPREISSVIIISPGSAPSFGFLPLVIQNLMAPLLVPQHELPVGQDG